MSTDTLHAVLNLERRLLVSIHVNAKRQADLRPKAFAVLPAMPATNRNQLPPVDPEASIQFPNLNTACKVTIVTFSGVKAALAMGNRADAVVMLCKIRCVLHTVGVNHHLAHI